MASDRDETPIEPPERGPASRVGSRDALAFAEHLGELTRSGLPLAPGFRALSAEVSSRSLQRSLRHMADRLDRGVPLADTLEDRGEPFPLYLRGLVLAGLRSGQLPAVLAQFVRYRSVGQELRRRFWSSMVYPMMLLVLVGMLIVFVMAMIVQPFELVVRDFGIDLPRISIFVIKISHAIDNYGRLILVNLAIAFGLTFVAMRIFLSPADRRGLMTSIPVMGKILLFGSLSEFCHLLGTLVEAQLPLPEAIELASQAVSDAQLAQEGVRMKSAIDRGQTFSQAIEGWPACPSGLAEMLAWAERHRHLPESLHLAGDMYEARARSQAGFASVLVGTWALILVVWGVGFAIVAMFLPLINLISRLSG